MFLNKDFEDLLHALNEEKVEYLIVGAYAVIYYTEPRFTKDLDVWIRPESENARKVINALKKFGAPVRGLSVEDLTNPEMVYQIGIEPNRVDILMGVDGLLFDTAWKNRKTHKYGEERIHLLSRKDLILNKRKVGRLQDQIDLQNLSKDEKLRKVKKKIK